MKNPLKNAAEPPYIRDTFPPQGFQFWNAEGKLETREALA